MTGGRQPSAFAITYAWIVSRGVAMITNTVAPVARSFAICDADVGRRHLVALLADDVGRLARRARASGRARLSLPKLSFW